MKIHVKNVGLSRKPYNIRKRLHKAKQNAEFKTARESKTFNLTAPLQNEKGLNHQQLFPVKSQSKSSIGEARCNRDIQAEEGRSKN